MTDTRKFVRGVAAMPRTGFVGYPAERPRRRRRRAPEHQHLDAENLRADSTADSLSASRRAGRRQPRMACPPRRNTTAQWSWACHLLTTSRLAHSSLDRLLE